MLREDKGLNSRGSIESQSQTTRRGAPKASRPNIHSKQRFSSVGPKHMILAYGSNIVSRRISSPSSLLPDLSGPSVEEIFTSDGLGTRKTPEVSFPFTSRSSTWPYLPAGGKSHWPWELVILGRYLLVHS